MERLFDYWLLNIEICLYLVSCILVIDYFVESKYD